MKNESLEWILVGFMAAVFLLYAICAATAAENDDFDSRLLDFNKKFYHFQVRYMGCSDHPKTDSNGVPLDCLSGGDYDVKRFNAAKRSAEKLFDLQPRP